jgi:hypothetical protein
MLICNNEGLLIKIEEVIEWNYTPNITLWAEWDNKSFILTMYKELKLQFVFMHVKSHQDDKTPAASLSLKT